MTADAFENALTADMALGCSTNSMLHLPAIANECGIKIDLDMVNKISARTPNICHLAPAGHAYMEDLNEAGGIYAVLNELTKKNLLHTDVMTVTGKTMAENIKGCINKNTDIIRPIDQPYSETGGIAVLKGNLAPDRCVVKRSARSQGDAGTQGPGKVFNSEEEAIAAITGGKIVKGDVVVIRYEGPAGGPGMREMLSPTSAIAGMGSGQGRCPHHRRPFLRCDSWRSHRSRFSGGCQRRHHRLCTGRRYHLHRHPEPQHPAGGL